MFCLTLFQYYSSTNAISTTVSGRQLIRRAFKVLIIFFGLGISFGVYAQSQSPMEVSRDGLTEDLQLWNRTLQGISTRLAESSITRQEIRRLNAQLQALQKSIVDHRDLSAARLDREQQLLDTLGAPPARSEIAESAAVASEREAIQENLSNYQSQKKQSDLLLARLNDVLEEMVHAQYATLVHLLTDRTVLPFAPGTLTDAFAQLRQRINRIFTAITDWWDSSPTTRFLPAIYWLLVIAAGWLAQRTLRVWRRGWQSRVPRETMPNRGQRFVMAIIYIVECGIVPATTLFALSTVLNWQSMLGTQVELKVSALLRIAAQLIVLLGVIAAVLAPRAPRWRITAFSNDAATGLHAAMRLYVLVTLIALSTIFLLHPTLEIAADISIGVSVSEEAIDSYFSTYPELSSSSGMLVLVVGVAALLNILRPRHWRFLCERAQATERSSAEESEADDDDDDDRFRGHRTVDRPNTPGATENESPILSDVVVRDPGWLLRIGLTIARFTLVVSLITAAGGFLNAGVYLSDRIASTAGLIGLGVMLRNLIATGLMFGTAQDTILSAYLRERLMLDSTGLSRLRFWLMLTIEALLVLAGIVALLPLWGLPLARLQLLGNLLFYGITIGDITLSLTDVLLAFAAFLLVLAMVRILRGVLSARILTQTRLDIGARDAVTTIVGYLGLILAALVGLVLLGIDLSRLALVLGALSIGIGFGLQHLVSNFVSGLILLTSRPIKSGDWIVVGQHQGYVKHISVINTEIQTFDNAAVMVPNSNLVSSEVLNWTHSSTVGRVIVSVRADYNASPDHIRKVLHRCLKKNDDVLRQPAALVLFMGFGVSSLDFELRFFIRKIDDVLLVSSDMRYQIVEAFEKAGISIPFPQHDVYLHDERAVADDTGA